MKKSELIQLLVRFQKAKSGSTDVRQLEAILAGVNSLTNEEELPSQENKAAYKVSARWLSGNPDTYRPNASSFFHGMSGDAVEDIMSFLPGPESYALSIALSTTKDREEDIQQNLLAHRDVRYVANQQRSKLSKQIKEHLKAVADADLTKVKAILESAKSKLWILKILLSASNERGNALAIAIQCWDWSMCEGGKPAMAETLMEYMRLLPEGESLINAQMQSLFPRGLKAHQEEQETQAAEFVKTILEPLAQLIKNASDADIKLAHDLTDVKNEDVDTYIANNLKEKPFWEALMQWRAAIKTFMEKSPLYNPYLLQQAFRVCYTKYETDKWQDTLSSGYNRLGLLSIHAIGGIQAFSPRLVQMLFARESIYEFYNASPEARKNFEPVRSTKFQYGGRDMGDCVSSGAVFAGLKYWGSVGSAPFLRARELEFVCRAKPSPWKSYAPLLNRTNSDSESKPVMRN